MDSLYLISNILLWFVQVVLAIYMLTPLISLLCYGVIALFGIRSPYERKPFLTDKKFDFGIVITAHQEPDFVLPLVDSILKQTYNVFNVYVVADDCHTDNLQFNDPRVLILKPAQALHAKVKSIEFAIKSFARHHDVIIILDSDSLLHSDFLQTMNNHFRKGYQAVQADFKPKNTDSLYARMDAVGDMFNFFIDREVRMLMGLSSAIWGSGIAFEASLYNNIQYKTLVGGFDKKLQYTLVLNTNRIAFAPDAVLFDEKITSGITLENQRARWIHSYFNYFKESTKILLAGLTKLNFNLVYFGFVLLRPPLFMVFLASFAMLFINYFLAPTMAIVWLLIFASFLISFILIVLLKGKDMRYIKTVGFLPIFAFRQILSMLKLKKAAKVFIKTPHTKLLYIEDITPIKK